MNESLEQIPLSAELLTVMRDAARYARQLNEPFVTARDLLLALLDEPTIGAALVEVLPREKLLELPASGDPRNAASRLPDASLPSGERGALPRFNTLAFKLPDGSASVWLGREALALFVEGVNRAEGRYLPKALALGIAADAVRNPGVLRALNVEPGVVTDAIFGMDTKPPTTDAASPPT